MLRLRSTWPILLSLAGSYLFSLAFAASNDMRDQLAGIPMAIIATLAVLIYRRAGRVRFRLRWRDLFQGWRMAGYLFSDTAAVLRVLATCLRSREKCPSRLAATAFQPGPVHSLLDDGRRALAVALTSATPNMIVLGIDRGRGLLIYHQLFPGKFPVMTQKLGAAP